MSISGSEKIKIPKKHDPTHPYQNTSFRSFRRLIAAGNAGAVSWYEFCVREYNKHASLWSRSHQITRLNQYLRRYDLLPEVVCNRSEDSSTSDSDSDIQELIKEFNKQFSSILKKQRKH